MTETENSGAQDTSLRIEEVEANVSATSHAASRAHKSRPSSLQSALF